MSKARERSSISTISNLTTRFLVKGTNIVIGVIIVRSLGAELKGQYNNLLLVTTLYAPVLMFGYGNGILYYGIKKVLDIRQFFWTGLLMILLLTTGITLLISQLVSFGWLGQILTMVDPEVFKLILLSIPIVLVNAFCDRVFRVYSAFRISNSRQVISANFLIVYYLSIWFLLGSISLFHAILGLLLSYSLQLVLNLFFILKRYEIQHRLDLSNLAKPWNYGIKVWLNQLIAKSNDRFDQFILSFLLTSSSLGLYVVGVAFCRLVATLPESYINVFYNRLTEREPKDAIRLYCIIQRMTFFIVIFFTLLIALSAQWVLPLVYGNDFSASVLVVYFYIPGVVFQIIARFNIKFYAALGKPLKNSLVYMAGMILSMPFYFILIPRMGLAGAAIASSIAYFGSYAFSFYQLHREYSIGLMETLIPKTSDLPYWRKQLGSIIMR